MKYVMLMSLFFYSCGRLDGLPGKNGHSVAFDQSSADSALCTNGGTVLSYGLDLNDNSNLDVSETKGVMITCNGLNGSNGADGQNGTNGHDGHDGATGAMGAQGPQGPQGVAGTNATPVTMVKLCNDNVSYPNVFVEYAACLNGNLFGVYSANGGFWTYLPNGTYESIGVGSNCNFSVQGCTVTH